MAELPDFISPEAAAELSLLHARMLLALQSIDWSIAAYRELVVAQLLDDEENDEDPDVLVIADVAVYGYPGFCFTRSGAVFRAVSDPDVPWGLVLFFTATEDEMCYLTSAMTLIIELCDAERLQRTAEAFIDGLPPA